MSSPLIVDSRNIYELPTIDKKHAAVCGDVSLKTTPKFGDKPQYQTDWILDELDSQGRHKHVFAWFGQTLRPNHSGVLSKLRQMLTKVLGKDPGLVFDMEELVGKSSYLTLGQKLRQDGSSMIQIVDYAPLPAGVKPVAIPANFVRRAQRVAPTPTGAVDKIIAGDWV